MAKMDTPKPGLDNLLNLEVKIWVKVGFFLDPWKLLGQPKLDLLEGRVGLSQFVSCQVDLFLKEILCVCLFLFMYLFLLV